MEQFDLAIEGLGGLDPQGEDNPNIRPPLKSREVLDLLLADAGVRRTVQIDDVPGLANIFSPIDGQSFYLCRYRGADLCGLLPPAFDDKPVWCAWLDAPFKEHLPAFLKQQSFGQYGNRTSDPWVHDQFFELSAGENDEQDESAAGIAFSATALWLDWQRVADDGYVTFVFLCDDELTVTAYAVNEETLESLGIACAGTFMKAVQMFGICALQERMRSIEDGKDCDPAWRENQRELPVCSWNPHWQQSAEESQTQISACGTVVWQAGNPSAIGLPRNILAYLPDELSDDEKEHLRVTVDPDLFETFRGTDAHAWVKVLPPRIEEGDSFELPAVRLLFIRKGNTVLQLEFPEAETPFAEALAQWKLTEICPVMVENIRNGRSYTLQLIWPSDAPLADLSCAGNPKMSELSEMSSSDESVLTKVAVAERVQLHCTWCHVVEVVEGAPFE